MNSILYKMLVFLVLSGCSNVAENVADTGADFVEDTIQKPSADECESYTTRSQCVDGGCPIFVDVELTVMKSDGSCSDAIQKGMCWTTKTGDSLEGGTITSYYRTEMNGEKSIAKSPSNYAGLLGWTICDEQCLCVSGS